MVGFVCTTVGGSLPEPPELEHNTRCWCCCYYGVLPIHPKHASLPSHCATIQRMHATKRAAYLHQEAAPGV